MPDAEGGAATSPRLRHKPRQEISACLKWLSFFLNFGAFLIGITILSLGVYLCVKDPRGITDWADVVLNPAIVLSIAGFVICGISMCGAVGALRDNIQLLKTFAICVFLSYILLVVATFLLFILFYSDSNHGLSAQSILVYALSRYHTNRNIADSVDYLQEQLECCGVSSTSAGYRDWDLSPQFNCSAVNPYPESCGVPFSCCRRTVISESAGSSNVPVAAMKSLECWQNALRKRPQDIEADIYTRGCLYPLRMVFETHALHIGIVVAVIIVPVCLSVCLSNVLARQIDHQRWLLEREARRNNRRRRKLRERYRKEQQRQHEQSDSPPKLPESLPPTKPPAEYSSSKKPKPHNSSPTRKHSKTRSGLPDVIQVKNLTATETELKKATTRERHHRVPIDASRPDATSKQQKYSK